MPLAFVALGASTGDRRAALHFALCELQQLGQVLEVSRAYQTAPTGGVARQPFLNAVARIQTPLDPPELLRDLHRIEAEAGRDRRRPRWSDRPLDLDLIAYADATQPGRWLRLNTPLQLPHPRAHQRDFVLLPLREVLDGHEPLSTPIETLIAQLKQTSLLSVDEAPLWPITH